MRTRTLIVLTIPGVPIAKARPRFVRRGKYVQTFDPQATEEGRFLFEVYRQLGKGFAPLDGALMVTLNFGMPIPKASKKKTEMMLNGQIAHTKKSDIDNLCKFVLDVCNGTVWCDDKQIIELHAIKNYQLHPSTEIHVEERNCLTD